MADTPENDAAAQVSETTRQAAESRQLDWAARADLTARAVVYLPTGFLALAVASGSGAKMDQTGALAQVLAKPFRPVMVALLVLGFVGTRRDRPALAPVLTPGRFCNGFGAAVSGLKRRTVQ